MWKLTISGIAVMAGVTCADAATIDTHPGPDDTTFFLVAGEFQFGDEKKFVDRALGVSKGVVLFASPGGNLFAGIEIGKAIKLKQFVTVVPGDVHCASACALAWLGGRKRFMARSARVGFHAAARPEEKGASGFGNALVGAYLNTLGLPDEAIFFLTKASPHEMNWLTFAEAARHGIDVAPFEAPEQHASPKDHADTPQGTASTTQTVPPAPDLVVPPARPQQPANLLRLEVAARVQARLRDLGFFYGLVDGVWGPRARAALRAFKAHNGLPGTDEWDWQTETALTGRAMPAPVGYVALEPDDTWDRYATRFLPLAGATLHPLNRADARKIQEQLARLGLYRLAPEGIWGADSRLALRDFKAANGLPPTEDWDAAVERALLSRIGMIGPGQNQPARR